MQKQLETEFDYSSYRKKINKEESILKSEPNLLWSEDVEYNELRLFG